MHVVSIKTGLKLVMLLFLGILLIISLSILIFKSFKSTTRAKTTSAAAETPSREGRANAENTLTLLLDPRSYPFVHEYRSTDTILEIKVDGRLWNQLTPKDKKSYLRDIAGVRSLLGLKPAVKILDTRSSLEMSSYEHGRLMLEENQDGS
jgi:hypothetical protein